MTALPPGSVVVGVDGTRFSDAAVTWAVDYAVARHAPLCILHGAGELAREWIPYEAEAREMLGEASTRITVHASELVRRQAPDLPVTVRAVFKDPREAVLDVQDDASMLVLGTRGRGSVASLLLGSVSAAAVAHARCPVTVVRPPRDGAGATDPVVVGVDIDGSAREALEVGYEIASMTHRPLVGVHAWSGHDTWLHALSHEHRLDALHLHERLFAEAMTGFAAKYPDVLVTERLVDQGAVAALVQESESASHLVLGSRQDHRIRRYFGSVSRSVVEHAHCPVTVARPVHRDDHKETP
jgi:nucleotide-binding universal stress UspA family protein